MPPQSKSLWRHQDFLKLWSAQTTSVFGSELASLAYPLTAIIVLQATTFQIGFLQASGMAAAASASVCGGVAGKPSRRFFSGS